MPQCFQHVLLFLWGYERAVEVLRRVPSGWWRRWRRWRRWPKTATAESALSPRRRADRRLGVPRARWPKTATAESALSPDRRGRRLHVVRLSTACKKFGWDWRHRLFLAAQFG